MSFRNEVHTAGGEGVTQNIVWEVAWILDKIQTWWGGEFQNVVVIICESPQVSLGVIGDRLVDPILVWNDTLRDGPRDVQGRAAGDSQVKIVSYIKDLQSQSPINHTIQS